MQIRRAIQLENLYHVRTDVMAADCGTRPDKVSVKDGTVVRNGCHGQLRKLLMKDVLGLHQT